MKKIKLFILAVTAPLLSTCAQQNTPPIEVPSEVNYTLETIVKGIDIPWGMAFLSSEEILVTEKYGVLYYVSEGAKKVVQGLPLYILGVKVAYSMWQSILNFLPTVAFILQREPILKVIKVEIQPYSVPHSQNPLSLKTFGCYIKQYPIQKPHNTGGPASFLMN